MKQLSTAAVLVCAIFVQSSLAADFVLLHSFGHVGTASDTPAALTLSGSSLIGTSTGTDGAIHGTVFRLNTDGTVFTTLHTFGGGDNDGASPGGALVVSNGSCSARPQREAAMSPPGEPSTPSTCTDRPSHSSIGSPTLTPTASRRPAV
jgi:hypothetical protein